MGNRKRTELELLIERKYYNSLFDALTRHIYEHRKELEFVDINKPTVFVGPNTYFCVI